MIKVKLSDTNNMKCFSGLIISRNMLRDYSIEITDSKDYDYEFIDHTKFINNLLTLQDSVDWGLEKLSKKTGDYFLFHGGDSTSIMGAYEVFINSEAKYLFKKQLLSQEDYKEETTINKWFFGSGTILDRGYKISSEVYSDEKTNLYSIHRQETPAMRPQPTQCR